MSAFRPRQGESKPARTWTAIVVALGTALALVAAFGGPKDVRRTDGGNVAFVIGACGASEPKAFPSGVIANTDRHTARIIAITPSAGSSRVDVRDFAVIDAGPAEGSLDPETPMSVGFASLPAVAHPHEILPGHQAIIEVRVTSSGRPSHLTGYDITVANGPATHVVHDEADVTFTGACSAPA